MAYYTMQPLAVIDTVNDHSGFYFFAFLAVFLAIVFTAMICEDILYMRFSFGLFLILYGLIIGYPAYHSWHSGNIKTFANVPVTAELMGTFAEVQRYEYRENKQNKDVTSRYKYVTYRTPDGDVTFEASLNTAYPRFAILYRN